MLTKKQRLLIWSLNLILGNRYSDYDNALKFLQLDRLSERRRKLCLNFAKKCIKHEKAAKIFPLKQLKKKLRSNELFKVNFASTERYQKSTIPFLQSLLNKEEKSKTDFKRACGLR